MVIWLVQTNLGHHQDYVMGIKEGCETSNNRFIGFRAVPFSGEVPQIDGKGPTVAFGSVDVIHAIHDSGLYNPGVFFNEDFTYSKYVAQLGPAMLNADGEFDTLKNVRKKQEYYKEKFAEHGSIFIRPNRDLKEFVGEVIDFDELADWIDRVDRKRTLLSTNTDVLVARPWKINAEWRLFIADKEIIGATRYKKNGKLDISTVDLPEKMLETAVEAIETWTPHPVCVMDLCETGGEYYIVEFNCFNGSGFYKHNIPHITRRVSRYVEKTNA